MELREIWDMLFSDFIMKYSSRCKFSLKCGQTQFLPHKYFPVSRPYGKVLIEQTGARVLLFIAHPQHLTCAMSYCVNWTHLVLKEVLQQWEKTKEHLLSLRNNANV